MSNTKYWVGIIFGAVAAIAVAIVCLSNEFELLTALFLAYLALSVVSQLIWGYGLGFSILAFLAGIGWIPAGFSLNCLVSGSIFWFIVSLFIIAPCFTFFIGCLTVGLTIYVLLSVFMYPFLLFSLRNEVY